MPRSQGTVLNKKQIQINNLSETRQGNELHAACLDMQDGDTAGFNDGEHRDRAALDFYRLRNCQQALRTRTAAPFITRHSAKVTEHRRPAGRFLTPSPEGFV